jgi:hypothetical protein
MDYEAAVATFFIAAPEGTTVPDAVLSDAPARRLRDALEPLAMHAVWAQEVYDALAPHGLDFFGGYVYGRGSALGDVPSAAVASAFAVFPPELVDDLWTDARRKIDREQLIDVRTRATEASLRKVLGDVTTEAEVGEVADTLLAAVDAAEGMGRPLFSALRAAPRPADPYGRLWRAADLVREHRGDSHVAACVAAGLGPCEMNIVTELWVGYSMGEYSNTRGWSSEVTEAAIAHLTVAGLIANWELTDDGRDFRATVEQRTDAAQRTLVEALGDRLEPLLATVGPWSDRCIAAGVFPSDPRKRAAG